MNKEYDAITASHYQAYRPGLHRAVLKSCLDGKSFTCGLDIGCGAGHSSIALADFCKSVIGIDPSTDMISKGIVNPNVSYKFFDKHHIGFDDNSFDIITLAGSLWYAKSQDLLDEIVRVGSGDVIILVYDFEVLLNEILTDIGFQSNSDNASPYNHQEDFSGLNLEHIEFKAKGSEKVQLQISSDNLAHLILSVKEQYVFLKKTYGSSDLFNKIVAKLKAISDKETFDVKANTFFTSYRIN